ncbi:MAG: hypothetical protein J6W49_02355 [Paludibacteraceae bacterium]|nr:hypothetical protein [Paludibacteraceae bacterium]MBP5742268.1 hypothetical protein [Paludibacteraceae bacterium]
MKDNKFEKKAYRWSLLMYYGVFVLVLLCACFGYMLQTKTQPLDKNVETVISSISYLYLMASIPFALWYSNKKVGKLGKVEDDEQRYKEYMRIVKLKIGLVAVAFVVNIILFYLLHSYSFLYAAGIAAVALIFCKPKEEDIAVALAKDEDEDL